MVLNLTEFQFSTTEIEALSFGLRFVTSVTYTDACGNKINNNDERTQFFRKIYLSHFIRNGCERVAKGLCVRGELETEQTATY